MQQIYAFCCNTPVTKYNWAFHKRRSQEHPIHSGVFQPFMPHQQLDNAQVRAGLGQMRGEAVPGCSELILFLIPARMAAAPDAPHGLVRDRSLDCAHLAPEKIDAWLLSAPVIA